MTCLIQLSAGSEQSVRALQRPRPRFGQGFSPSGAVNMQHVAQPAGTPAARAVLNRGEDPLLIAPTAYAFFIACKDMLHPTPVAGNHLSVQHSSVVGLIP